MKYCPFCGSGLKDDMVFCPKCGKKHLNAVENPDAIESTNIEPISSECQKSSVFESVSPAADDESSGTNATRLVQKKSRRGLLLFMPFLMLAMGLIVYFSAARTGANVAVTTAANSVLYLEVLDRNNDIIATASGFIAEDGTTLITNYHVIEGAHCIVAYTPDGEKSTEINTVLSYDIRKDLAILECKNSIGVSPLLLGDSDTAKQGDEIYAVGYPLGLAHTLSNGVVSSRYKDKKNNDTIQITAAVSSGSSGGALLNKQGHVIGVICSSYIDGQNLNTAIPSSYVRDLISNGSDSAISLAKLYSIQHPDDYYVGLRIISITPQTYNSDISWQEARVAAARIYEEWLSGEATETSLMAIMDKYGEDQGGGQLHIQLPGEFVEEIDKWAFDQARRVGDVAIIENAYGYSICFFSGKVVHNGENGASEFLQRKVAEQALDIDRRYGRGAYGGSDWVNQRKMDGT